MAEAIFRQLVEEAGLSDQIQTDSAGTAGYHLGQLPDPRTRQVCQSHGIPLDHRARRVQPEDFFRFQYILAADAKNLSDLESIRPAEATEVVLASITAYDPHQPPASEVPDPYYGEIEDFEAVYALLKRCLRQFLSQRHKSL